MKNIAESRIRSLSPDLPDAPALASRRPGSDGGEAATPGRAVAAQTDPGWRAELELGFESRHGRTRLVRRWHSGPLRVQKPFYPSVSSGPAPCQVLILHPPGGVVGGDRLSMNVALEADSRVLITTPGATKFYRSAGCEAVQRSRLRVATGATLEWTPQETILFDSSLSRIETRVDLEPGATFLGWEITALGRPAARAPFARGRCRQRMEIFRGGIPIWIERSEYTGGGESLSGQWGLAGRTAAGVMVCTGVDAESLVPVRAALVGFSEEERLAAVTVRGEVTVLRALASDTRPILELFASLRETLLGVSAPSARIWAT